MINMARYNKAVVITPSDTVNFGPSGKGPAGEANLTDAIFVGVAGDITAVLQDGTAVLFKAVAIGILPVAVKRVNATATTATNLLALYQI